MRYIDKSKCKTVKERGIDRDVIQTRELTRNATRIAEYLKLGVLKTRDGYYRIIRESGLGSPEHADAIFDTLAEVDMYLKSLAPDAAKSTKRGVTSSYSGDGRAEDDLVNLQFRTDITQIKQALMDFEDFCFDTVDEWEGFVSEADQKAIWRHTAAIRKILNDIVEKSRRQDLLPYE